MTTKARQSNIELLRIVSMMLVLIVHADFASLGPPSRDLMLNSPAQFTFRVLMEFVSILCVNIFVVISGWFSIRTSVKDVCKYLWQCLYFSVGIYLFFVLFKLAPVSFNGVIGMLYLGSGEWFVKAYLALMILAPVLNAFVEHASRRQLETLLVAFYAFQTLFSFHGSASFILSGNSTFSFLGLYLLARYMRIYHCNISSSQCVALFVGSIVLNAFIYSIDVWMQTDFATGICMSYANPLVVIGAMSITILFSRLNLASSKIINYVSGSCFAVYLLHCNHWLFSAYCHTVANLYSSFHGLQCVIVIFMYILAVYALAIILDVPRRAIWQFFNSRINERTTFVGNSAGLQY